jgi:anti-anti-sigma factor
MCVRFAAIRSTLSARGTAVKTKTMTELKVSKYLDVREARDFALRIKPELRENQPCVVVDMSEVEQIDAAALEMLLRCMLKVARHDGTVRLAGLSPQAATVLEITRMDRIFAMFPEAAEAQASFEVAQFEQPLDEPARQHSAA